MSSSRQLLRLLNREYLAYARNASSKNASKLPKKTKALPHQHLAQLKSWAQLIQKEIDWSDQQIEKALLQSDTGLKELNVKKLTLSSLKFTHVKHCPMRGRITIFRNEKPSISTPKFRLGTPIMVYRENDFTKIAEGIIVRISSEELQVKFTNINADLEEKDSYCVFVSNHTGSSHSLKEFLEKDFTKSIGESELFLYSRRGLAMPSIHKDVVYPHVDKTLDESQRRAVGAALNKKRPFVCIRGPPGTGKTRVLAEIVKLLTQKRQKVLVCAPTHVAIQNAIDKTISAMDIDESEKEKYIAHRDISSEDDKYIQLENIIELITIAKNRGDKELSDSLKKKANKLKYKLTSEHYIDKEVIFSTIGSSAIFRLKNYKWYPDVVIIDEAGQCTEPSVWPALSNAHRCILVGDEMQLPPVVFSSKAKDANLHVSLLERLASEFSKNNIVFQLNVQYRMNKNIMRWSSDQFYNSSLIAAESVADINISEISSIPNDCPAANPLILFDTDTIDTLRFKEKEAFDTYSNAGEAKLIKSYVELLLKMGVDSSKIGIITPYSGQVREIKKSSNFPENLLVSSVDAFQGNEKDIIIFSLVRNNNRDIIGFLKNYRRLNVAITRAKRQFVLVGSGKILRSDKTLKTLFTNIRDHGKILGSKFSRKIL